MSFNRREFMVSTAAVAGASMLPFAPAQAGLVAKAKYTRYSATSDQGKAMLKSYAVAIEKMLKLPPDHPHNWFRNAFVHFMDCPHGNWWFYVWHRGYVGFFEETVRRYSDNPNFAFPYWDWTETPRIPNEMFDGPLTPVDKAFLPFTKDLDTFTAYAKPAMLSYWNALNKAQRKQLDLRGYTTFDLLWNDVTGYDPSTGTINKGNQAFAATDRSRYLSRDNPNLDPKTAKACSPATVMAGLSPNKFYSPDVAGSFTSSKTASHNVMPGNDTKFSVLEGQPHNLVHNFIGGVGPWDPGPYGNMTNFLSPVDPVFFLHHANMDRLWDVWTRKQQRMGLPILPTDKTERAELVREPFLFFVRADGTYVIDGKAGDYLSTNRFEYDYAPGFGAEETMQLAAAKTTPKTPVKGTVKGGVGSVTLTAAPTGPVVATVTVPRPAGATAGRTFDVLVNAPAGVTQVEADSPYYAGTVGFFGPAMHGMAHDATFAVPLPQQLHATAALNATSKQAPATLEIRLAPTYDKSAPAPAVKGVTVQSL
ncbi:tyrosinase family protein [Azospirillum sp. TSO35-2]|uniref:tyrosinase family protein n=1 Tax=Azospirillum sp. TSO35-2 TaxID=716796 RepID=UPI000D61DC42|nr:tyrosinase family protein [Azospirillum sp. TSO35-2]PWC39184.1 tyrosinase [Azospirillum sp. TSO35-2]